MNYNVSTGNILTLKGEKGLMLECLSIGDYGKHKNIKADFLGFKEEINGVPHGDLLPLSEKWVITISSQYGCSMGCKFCDVPKVGGGINVTFNDLLKQVTECMLLHPEVKYTQRLNLHYARMGEPTYNNNILYSAVYLSAYFKMREWGFHPVVSTMMPKNNKSLYSFIYEWLRIKNIILEGNAGLQISINTTNEEYRRITIPLSMSFEKISKIFEKPLKQHGLKGRKIALNFAITDTEIDGAKLLKYFDPKYFMCKITPMHITKSCIENNLITKDGYEKYYPYKNIEEDLKKFGYDVIVFIPSKEEDESRITCGNAILADLTNK